MLFWQPSYKTQKHKNLIFLPILIIQARKFSHELLTKEMPSVFFLTKEGNNHILIFLLYFRQYMFLFVEKLMLLLRYVWNGKCYKTLPALNIFSFCWIMVTWHFSSKKFIVWMIPLNIVWCLTEETLKLDIKPLYWTWQVVDILCSRLLYFHK